MAASYGEHRVLDELGERAPAERTCVGLWAFESPGAPRPLQRAHGPTPLLHARVAYGGWYA